MPDLLAEEDSVIEIEDKPDRPVCATHGPLRWGWFPDTKQGARWVSFTLEPGAVLVPHVCDDPERPAPRWQPDEVIAERAHRHMDEIRQQFGWPENQKLTEKGQ
jgi:hypothetical protein